MRLSVGVLERLLEEYLDAKKFSKMTGKNYRGIFNIFIRFLAGIGKDYDLRDFTREDMKRYIDYIYHYKKKNGKPLKNASKMAFFFRIRSFLRYLYRMEYLLYNPTDQVDLKIKEDSIARKIMSIEEMERFLSCITCKEKPTQARDRAMFEIMYITGMRSGEIRSLKINDVDFEKEQILIRDGKGSRDRIVPIGTLSKKYLHEYINNYRKKFFEGKRDNGLLFISRKTKKKMTHNALNCRFRRYTKKAGLSKDLTPHCIRHTAGSHMLEGGAGIKSVKMFLGHKSIETTVTYTHFMIDSIKKLYRKYHARENNLYEEVPPDLEEKVIGMMVDYRKKY